MAANKICPAGTTNTNDGRCSTIASYACPSGSTVSGSNCNTQGGINGWIVEPIPSSANVVLVRTVDLVYLDGRIDLCSGFEPYGYIQSGYTPTREFGGGMFSGTDGYYYCGYEKLTTDGDGNVDRVLLYFTSRRYSLSYATSTYAATPASYTYQAATCPAGWDDAGGANCVNLAAATDYTPNTGQISSIVCTPTVVAAGSNVNCTVTGSGAPAGVVYGGSTTLTVSNGGGTATCTWTGSATANCTPVSVGSSGGTKTVTTALGGTLNITVNAVNMAKVNWNFTPDQGNNSPLFRSSDNTTINISNLKTNFDLNPSSDTRYTCKLEYRNLSDRLATTPAWNTLSAADIAYNTTTGCGFSLTKAQRNNNLNFSLKLTITDTTNTTPSAQNPNTFTQYNEYIYRFLGAGTATGG